MCRKALEEKLFDTEKARALHQRMEALCRSVKEAQGRVAEKGT